MFWSDFFANFLSDLMAGVFLGTVLALWIGKRLSKSERSQQRQQEKQVEIEKAIRYLELLRVEVKYLVDQLPKLIEQFRETGWGREIRIPTPLWDALQPSGELPKLLEPRMLGGLVQFYDHLTYAKRARDLVVDSWLVSQPDTVPGLEFKSKAFQGMTLNGLSQAGELGEDLLHSFDEYIQALKEELDKSTKG